MLSRALSFATVTLVIGCLTAVAVRAQRISRPASRLRRFSAGTCNACHKSPRGLLNSVPASSLSGFLRQHYTTSSDMASVLASYLVSNGAADHALPGEGSAKHKDGAKEGQAGGRDAACGPAAAPTGIACRGPAKRPT